MGRVLKDSGARAGAAVIGNAALKREHQQPEDKPQERRWFLQHEQPSTGKHAEDVAEKFRLSGLNEKEMFGKKRNHLIHWSQTKRVKMIPAVDFKSCRVGED